MATLTTGPTYSVHLDRIDADLLNHGNIKTQTDTQLSIGTGNGNVSTFLGSGFTYQDKVPTGGTVGEYDFTLNGVVAYKVADASVSAASLYGAIHNGDSDAILDLFLGGDDNMSGGAMDDYLDARGGNNNVNGGAGADVLYAGGGNNHVYGNAAGGAQGANDGGDEILVGNGTNYVNGNAGDDTITAGNGANRVYGGSGDDVIQVGNGSNYVNGNLGNDQIVAGNGTNTLRGGAGDDQIFTNGATAVGANIEMGDLGRDQFHTGMGYDLMTGGADADVFWLGGVQEKGSAAAVIGGQTYYDEITDFAVGEDHLVIRNFVPDSVSAGSTSYGSVADAQAAAQAQLTASGDDHLLVANQVGQDTYLFFGASGESTTIDSVLKLDGISAQAVTTASFLNSDGF